MVSALLLSFALAAGPSTGHHHQASQEGHHSADHENAQMKLNHGKKWETDKPLRENMAKIRTAVQDKISAGNGSSIPQTVTDAVNSMIKNCRFSPEADATLHFIIGDLMKGASMIQEAHSATEKDKGLAVIRTALKNYDAYFNDNDTSHP